MSQLPWLVSCNYLACLSPRLSLQLVCSAPSLGSSCFEFRMVPTKTSMLLERGYVQLPTEIPLFRGRPRAEFSCRRAACGMVRSVLGGAEERSVHTDTKNVNGFAFPALMNYMAGFAKAETPSRLYREKFVIRCYEVATDHTISIQTIACLLQEVAFNHMMAGSGLQARNLGLGFATTESMRKQRLIWVTTRMHIEVEQYPLWGDEVEIETWFQFEGRIRGRRDWIITNSSGKVIARATSTWAMVNQDTRRLARTNEFVRNEYSEYVMEPPRWAFSDDGDSSKKLIPKLDDYWHTKDRLEPRRADLDMNHHVNNVTYISWILESLPVQVLRTHELQSITLEFRHECDHGDVVVSKASRSSSSGSDSALQEFTHLVQLVDGNKEVNRGSTRWRKKAFADYKEHLEHKSKCSSESNKSTPLLDVAV